MKIQLKLPIPQQDLNQSPRKAQYTLEKANCILSLIIYSLVQEVHVRQAGNVDV